MKQPRLIKCPKCKSWNVNIQEFCMFSKIFEPSDFYKYSLERIEGVTHQDGICNKCNHRWKIRKSIDVPMNKVSCKSQKKTFK